MSEGALPVRNAKAHLLWRTPAWRTVRRIVRRRLALPSVLIILIVAVAAVGANVLAPHSPTALDVRHQLEGPSWSHPFGTDQLGRDLFSRMIYGSRVALQVGLGAATVGVLVGVPLGLVAGYSRGVPDMIISRVIDCLLAFPAVLLAIAVVAFLGQELRSLVFALGAAATPWFARLVRAETLGLRERDFVLAARASGASDSRVLVHHLLPNVMAPVIVQFSLSVGQAIIAEASLSFLGIGVRPPTPTWGGELQFGFGFLDQHVHLWAVPCLFIFLLTMSFNLLGDALRDALDPKLRDGGTGHEREEQPG